MPQLLFYKFSTPFTTMKLLSVVLFATLAAFAVAQGIVIGYPPANKHIHPGQKLTVQVVQPVRIEALCAITVRRY